MKATLPLPPGALLGSVRRDPTTRRAASRGLYPGILVVSLTVALLSACAASALHDLIPGLMRINLHGDMTLGSAITLGIYLVLWGVGWAAQIFDAF